MITELHELAGDLEEEKLLAQLKDARLDGVGKGKLSLTNKRVEFERRSGFLSPPRVEFSIALSEVSSAKIKDASNTLMLEWLDGNGERVLTQLVLPESDATTHLCRSLNKKLKVLRQVAELQERRACYKAFLWKTAYHIWLMADLLSQAVQQLTHEDWDAVDASLNEAMESAKALSLESALDVNDAVHGLIKSVSSRDALLVLRNITATLKSVGTALSSDLPSDEKWEDLALEDSPGLNWRDIRYIFLFTSWYKLLSLWHQLGETKKIEDSLPRLVTLLSILADRISRQSHLGSSATGKDDSSITDSIDSAARNLETLLKINAGMA